MNSLALARRAEYMDVFCNPTLFINHIMSGYGKKAPNPTYNSFILYAGEISSFINIIHCSLLTIYYSLPSNTSLLSCVCLCLKKACVSSSQHQAAYSAYNPAVRLHPVCAHSCIQTGFRCPRRQPSIQSHGPW